MTKLKLYNLDDEYIDYLQEKEKALRGITKVPNKTGEEYQNRKPFVGIVLKISKYHYFVPLTHP